MKKNIFVRNGVGAAADPPNRSVKWLALTGLVLLVAFTLRGSDLVYSTGTFAESWKNDGSIGNTITVTITNGNAFVTSSGDFIAAGLVVTSNIPSGLTAIVTQRNSTNLVLILSGVAGNPTIANNASNVVFQFLDTAFTNGSAAGVNNNSSNLVVGYLAQNASNWWVSTTGSDANPGTNAATALATVAAAVTKAQSAANDVIHLMAGVYTQNNISIAKVVTLTGNSSADTILQAAMTAFTTNKNILSNSKNGVIKNLTLQNGNLAGDGGAVTLSGANEFYFDNCRFYSNAASGKGGAVFNGVNSGSSIIINFLDCQFVGNRATGSGGAVYTLYMSIFASNCTFLANTAGNSGGALYRDGVAGTASFSVYDSFLSGNQAATNGGAIYGGGSSSTIVGNSTLSSNSAGNWGGAMYHTASSELIYNSTIAGNTASNFGGGLYHSGTTLISLYNSTIFANRAETNGGGVYIVTANAGYAFYSTILAGNTAGVANPDIYANSTSGIKVFSRGVLGDCSGVSNSIATGSPNASFSYVGTNGAVQASGVLSLAFNGGPYPTCALQTNSVALDHGTNLLGLVYDGRGVGCLRSVGAQCDIGAYELKTLTYSGTMFHEYDPPNNGSISNTLTVTLVGDTFNASVSQDLVALGKIATNNVPAGLTVLVTCSSPTQAVVSLAGNALNNNAADTLANLQVAFLDAAFTSGYSASVDGSSRTNLGIIFFGAGAVRGVTYGTTNFNESVVNDGTIANNISIALSNDTFNGSPGVVVANCPSNLVPVITVVDPMHVTLSFTGAATNQRLADNITNLTVTFLDSAFGGGSAATVGGYTRSNLTISFLDPVITNNSDTFVEAPTNNGSIAGSIVFTLIGDALNATNGEDLVGNGKVVANNVPPGLTAVVTVSNSQAIATLSGKATNHNIADNVGNLSLVFQNTAFVHGAAAVVSNSTVVNLKINFMNPTLIYSGSVFAESATSPGVIGNTLTLTLAGDTFGGTNGENLVGSGRVAVTHVPSGLTAVLTQVTNTQAILALTNVAAPHDLANSISNLTVTFLNSGFAGNNAALVTNAAVTNLVVSFVTAGNLYVATNGNDITGTGASNNPYATVAKAVSMAQNAANDMIHLLPGVYTESNITVGKIVVITGSGRSNTIIQAAAAPLATTNRIFTFNSSGSLMNLTLRYGCHTNYGGAVTFTSPYDFLFSNCVFSSNAAVGTARGGAVSASANYGLTWLTFEDCQFVGNQAGTEGGAIYAYEPNVRITNCVFTANTSARNGGAVSRDAATAGGILEIYNSLLTGNTASNGGGAVYSVNGTILTIWGSTMASNVAGTAGGAFYSSMMSSNALVCNSTLCHNQAGYGGGGYHWSNGGKMINIYNSTIWANSATTNGGGVYVDYSAGLCNLYSSIVASNTAASAGPDIYQLASGAAGTVSRSLLGDNSGAGSGIVTGAPNAASSYVGTNGAAINPLLAPLTNNGGPVPTCVLLPGSVAIDHGTNILNLATDQRGDGYARQQGLGVDIGAYERPSISGSVYLVR